MSNDSVITAIKAHHDELARQLRDRVARVARDASTGDVASARGELERWCHEELLPHAVAEERTLYDAAGRLEPTRLLIRAMIAEHRALDALIGDLAAGDAVRIAGVAASIEALFQVHLGKENDLMLPALDAAGADLDALLAGMHDLLGEHE